MGCRISKPEESTAPVVLCRERRDLIRTVAGQRRALSSAHVAYFQSLSRVGDALVEFVQQDFVSRDSISTPSVLTLPRSPNGKRTETDLGMKLGSEEKGSCSGHIHFSDTSSATHLSPFHSSNASPVHDTNQHCDNISDFEEIEEEEEDEVGSNGHMDPFSNTRMPHYYYMKAGPTVPNTVYQHPYMNSSSQVNMDNGYGYNYNYHYPNYGFNSAPELVPMQNGEVRRDYESVPPPPPVAEVSPWDFFNPFNSYHQYAGNVGILNGSLSGPGSIKSSPNSSDLREREGIPELEEDTEQESIRENSKKQSKQDTSATSNETSQESESQVDCTEVIDEVQSGTKIENDCKNEKIKKKKKVSFEMNQSLVDEDRESVTKASGTKEMVVSVRTGTRDVEEVVKEIKEEFSSLVGCNDEMARLLEVGTVQYRSKIRVLSLAFSRILGSFLPSTSSRVSEKTSKAKKITGTEIADEIDFNNLSSILERLYLWEKKLYKEVKREEKLRLMYEKKWNKLRALDENGAEPNKIHDTRMAVRDLITKINVSTREAEFISTRIHKLRDDEFQPLLLDVFQGFMRMWRVIFECHHKQFQAILESKPDKLFISETHFERTNSSDDKNNPTVKLEAELLNWSLHFGNWIKAQKSYIRTLNLYLSKWLPEGTEPQTLLDSPPVFVFSKDWALMSESVSEKGVVNAMNSFASNVRDLLDRQGLERQQKIRAEYLSKDLSKRVNGLTGLSIEGEDNGLKGGKMIMGLDELKKRVDLEKGKYKDMVKVGEEMGLGNLKTGLGTVFEALEGFSMEILRGFDGVRVRGGGVT